MSIEKLPDEILLYIFYRIKNFETLHNCSEVNKRWRSLIGVSDEKWIELSGSKKVDSDQFTSTFLDLICSKNDLKAEKNIPRSKKSPEVNPINISPEKSIVMSL
uniref:F-box domain-containing protein n=1 Tax=Tetranychus urticae TaxID=32264 RepID=T1JXI9_TETUR